MQNPLFAAAALAVALASSACTSVPFEASQPGLTASAASGKCDAMSDWFERQRALTDGNVNPQEAAFDRTCRTGHRRT